MENNIKNLGYSSWNFSFWKYEAWEHRSTTPIFPQAFKEEVERRFGISVREFEGKVLEEIIAHGKTLGLDSKYIVAWGDHLDPEYTIRYPYSTWIKTMASQGRDEKGIGLFRGWLNDSIGEKEFKLDALGLWNAGHWWSLSSILLVSDYLK